MKIRGLDFEPLRFELERYTSDRLVDHKGRQIPTVLAKPLLEVRAREIGKETLSREDRLLLSVEVDPGLSLSERALAIDLRLANGQAHKTGVNRILQRLQKQKLVRRFRADWELWRAGQAPGGRPAGGLGHASHVLGTGCRRRDVPAAHGPPTTVGSRVTRWSRRGVWQRMLGRMAAAGPVPEELALNDAHDLSVAARPQGPQAPQRHRAPVGPAHDLAPPRPPARDRPARNDPARNDPAQPALASAVLA